MSACASQVNFVSFLFTCGTFLCYIFIIIRLTTYGLAEMQVEGDGNCQVCCVKFMPKKERTK